MSTLDKILNRAKRGSVDDDDTNYVTVVDRPPSTYSYQKKTIPSTFQNTIPTTYTNDFERIYQVVKSSYNCGQVQYNYEKCEYNDLVQNYVQKGEAIVSSMKGYSNVSLQDLPLACNIPSVVYNTCSPPTNMLTTEENITNTGFRLNMYGEYLYPAAYNLVEFKSANSNGFNLEETTFLVEKKSIKELDKLILPNFSYFESYEKYKKECENQGIELDNFYYLKHRKTGKYVIPTFTKSYMKAANINITRIYDTLPYVVRIYDENGDIILSVNNDLDIIKNSTNKIVTISENDRSSYNNVNINFESLINISNITVSAQNSETNLFNYDCILRDNSAVQILGFNYVKNVPISNRNLYSPGYNTIFPMQVTKLQLGEINYFYCKIIAENFNGKYLIKSNIYPIIFTFTVLENYMISKTNILSRAPIVLDPLTNDYYGETEPFLIENIKSMTQFYLSFPIQSESYKSSIFQYTLMLSNSLLTYNIIYSPNMRSYNTITNTGNNIYTQLQDDLRQMFLSPDGNLTLIIYWSSPETISSNVINRTFSSWIYNITMSTNANVIYVSLLNREIWCCINKNIWFKLSFIIPFELYTNNWLYLLTNRAVFDTNFSGRNIIIMSDNNKFYISVDYGFSFTEYNLLDDNIRSVKCFSDEFYISTSTSVYKFIPSTNKLSLLFDNPSSGDTYIVKITNKYIVCSCLLLAQTSNLIYYLINKETKNVNYVLSSSVTHNFNIDDKLEKLIIITDKCYIGNTNINTNFRDNIFRLNDGLSYASYSFKNISTYSINSGVKNLYDTTTYVLSSENNIIKKIKYFLPQTILSITSSSILKDNTILYTLNNSGSIKDIDCSYYGDYIIAAVYNSYLLLWDKPNSRFNNYNESNEFKDASRNEITNITRYWISVSCSYRGQYMSACAYNGNIFISTNYGVLFTSSPENFAKKWVQIVMNKNSDNNKDGIVQLACAEDGLFISYDRGANWSQIRNEVIDNALSNIGSKWSSVAISDSGKYMLATVYGGYIYASYNYGYDWSIYGISRKECYEPVVYPNTITSPDYLNYNVSASTTSSGNIINVFRDDNSIWSPTNTDTNINVTIKLPYNFLLTDINIINLNTQDVKVTVSGSNTNDDSNWIILGNNLNLYSTVDRGVSYYRFRLTFSLSSIQIQRIKLLGQTDFVSAGVMSQVGNWSSCAIKNERTHHVANFNSGIFSHLISTSFGKVIKIFSLVRITNISVYDKQNNIIISSSIDFSNNIYTINFNNSYDFGRIETNINSNGSVSIEDTINNITSEVFRIDNVSLNRVFFWF